MAKKHRNETLVGITVLVVLALSVYIVVALGDWENLFADKQLITVRLPQKVGLKQLMVDSPIFLGGVKIGQIVEAGIEKPQPSPDAADQLFVFFTMSIPKDYILRQDCALMAASNVLGGQASLVINDLGSQGAVIEDGQTVTLTLEGGIGEAMNSLKRELDTENPDSLLSRLKYEINREQSDSIMAKVVEMMDNLKQITVKINEQVTVDEDKQTLMAKLHVILERFGSVAAEVNNQLNTENQQAMMAKLHAAMDKLDASLAEIETLVKTNRTPVTETIASLKKSVTAIEQDLPEITARLKEALGKADIAMDSAKVSLDQVKELLVVNRQNVDDLIRNFQEMSVNLKMASREIRRAPWRLIYKPKKGELELQGLIDSAGSFATAAEKLDSATLRLQTLVQEAGSATVDNQQIKVMIAELETTFQQYKTAEEKFWNEIQ